MVGENLGLFVFGQLLEVGIRSVQQQVQQQAEDLSYVHFLVRQTRIPDYICNERNQYFLEHSKGQCHQIRIALKCYCCKSLGSDMRKWHIVRGTVSPD
jgi:hypothetical protein